jgi:DeoR family ulaG and ulaABCDEF operon transcriptional repressor
VLESHPLSVKSIRDLADCADEIIVLADSRKLSIRARHKALPLSRISRLITDSGLGEADARMLAGAGVEIIIADEAARSEDAGMAAGARA